MRQALQIFLSLILLLTLLSCDNIDKEDESQSVNNDNLSRQEYSNLLKMPVGFVRNSDEALELEYDRSMKNRFEAEELLPETYKSTNKKTEDVSILSVWNRSNIQMFIYGGGSTKNGLNADLLFFVHRGDLSFIFDKTMLGEKNGQMLIREIYAADLNEDEAYEIYLNLETGNEKKASVIGINLADKSIISPAHSGETHMHYFEDRLFLIQIPEGGSTGDALCSLASLDGSKLLSNEDSPSNLSLAALSKWQEVYK